MAAVDERLLKKIGFAELFRLQEQLVVLRGLEPSGSQTLGMHRVHPIIGTFRVDRQEAWGRKKFREYLDYIYFRNTYCILSGDFFTEGRSSSLVMVAMSEIIQLMLK